MNRPQDQLRAGAAGSVAPRPEHIVVVGGGPAGLEVARAHREAGGRAAITLVTDEPHLPYRRPPLTKAYLRTGEGRAELALEPAAWFSQAGVTVRHAAATAVDPDAGRLTLAGGDELAWDALVLATGSEPIRPPVPGADLDGVLVMRGLDDADALRARVAAGARRAVVVGSGFIGCEAAASLRALGCAVTLVSGDAVPQEARLGEAAGRVVAGWLGELGVQLRLGTQVAAIRRAASSAGSVPTGGSDSPLDVVCDDDSPAIAADVVVLGAGVVPRLELARSAGLAIDEEAPGIRCDAALRTSHPRIWAAGDIALAEHPLAGRALRVEHWGDATAHGAAIGATLAGRPSRWEAVPGFWSTIGERTLKLAAWGDGWDEARLDAHLGGAFSVWYARDGVCVGVLTHDADADYERGAELVGQGAPVPPAAA